MGSKLVGLGINAHIFRLLHSAHACGVVIRLEPVEPGVFPLSWGSFEGFRGVTP